MGREIDASKEEDQQNATARRARGEFVRGVSAFRNAIGDSADHPPEAGRYHLFVALNCPWCHRATLARAVLGLTEAISMDVAFPTRTDEDDPAGPNLWMFAPDRASPITGAPLPECTAETATGRSFRLVREIYAVEGSDERSVPILYDKRAKRIVSNESAEIIRMLDAHADALARGPRRRPTARLYPGEADRRAEIDQLNELIYVAINNGSYKAGFSSDQAVYEAAFDAYFDMLERLEVRLSDGRAFLTGDAFSEADLRLFPTLYRHDPIYLTRMKLNRARILDYTFLWRWLCRVYALKGVAESNSMLHCRQGYFGRTGSRTIPTGPIWPKPYPEAYRHPELAGPGKIG